jgi:hypothetical protein
MDDANEKLYYDSPIFGKPFSDSRFSDSLRAD